MSSTNTPYVVGIAGGSASGKSTFTRMLLSTLQEQIPDRRIVDLHTDRYFRVGAPDMPTFVSPSSGRKLPDYNHPDTIDWQRLVDDIDQSVSNEDGPDILIVEGHFVLTFPEVRERLDLRLYIDLDADTRALRRMIRHLEHHGDPLEEHTPEAIAAYYLESAKVGHARHIEPSRVYADLTLRGDGDFSRTAYLITTIIEKESAS